MRFTRHRRAALRPCIVLCVGDMFIAQAAVGVLLWGGLFLRYPALRQLLPVMKG